MLALIQTNWVRVGQLTNRPELFERQLRQIAKFERTVTYFTTGNQLGMSTTNDSDHSSRIFVTLAIFSCILTCTIGLADEEEQTVEASDTMDSYFTRLDTIEAINAYRDERYTKVAEGLAESKLSEEHQELLANAITEMYLGIPVSSYIHTEREESSREDPKDSSNQWTITEDGRIQHMSESITYDLNSPSPFVSLPPIPFEAATGRVLEESDSEATFVFDMAMTMSADADEEFSGMAKQMKWVAEVMVGKNAQSPMSLVMKLEKPIRKRFLFKLTTMTMELHYSYVESCAGYSVNRLTVQVNGSVIFVGKLDEFAESTFSEIECTQPLVRLVPDQDESNFFQF